MLCEVSGSCYTNFKCAYWINYLRALCYKTLFFFLTPRWYLRCLQSFGLFFCQGKEVDSGAFTGFSWWSSPAIENHRDQYICIALPHTPPPQYSQSPCKCRDKTYLKLGSDLLMERSLDLTGTQPPNAKFNQISPLALTIISGQRKIP